MPKNWKYIKKLLEKEFLCDSLKGHITYDLTDYKPAPWYQQHFIMKFNDEVLLDVSQPDCKWDKNYQHNNVYPYHLSRSVSEKYYDKYDLTQYGISKDIIESLCSNIIDDTLNYIAHQNGIYGVKEVVDAISIYLHNDIQSSLNSAEYFINALAVLDRRCGKRTLEKFAKWEYAGLPIWLKRIYRIRFESEGVKYSPYYLKTNEAQS